MCEGEGCKPTPETVVPVSFPGSLLPRSASLVPPLFFFFPRRSLHLCTYLFVCFVPAIGARIWCFFLLFLPLEDRVLKGSPVRARGEGRGGFIVVSLLFFFAIRGCFFFFIRVRRTMNRRMESTGRLIRQISSSRTSSSCLPLPPWSFWLRPLVSSSSTAVPSCLADLFERIEEKQKIPPLTPRTEMKKKNTMKWNKGRSGQGKSHSRGWVCTPPLHTQLRYEICNKVNESGPDSIFNCFNKVIFHFAPAGNTKLTETRWRNESKKIPIDMHLRTTTNNRNLKTCLTSSCSWFFKSLCPNQVDAQQFERRERSKWLRKMTQKPNAIRHLSKWWLRNQ